MDPFFITSLATISGFLILYFFCRFFVGEDHLLSVLYSSYFITSPLYSIGGTLQKLIYFGDIFGLYFLYRGIGYLIKGVRKLDLYDFLAFLVLVGLPCFATILRLAFSGMGQWEFTFQMLYRSILAYFSFSCIRTDIFVGKVKPITVSKVGFFGFFYISLIGAGQYIFGYSTDILLASTDFIRDIVDGTGGYGGGVIGMWRGEYGGLAAAIIGFGVALFLGKSKKIYFPILFVGVFIFVILSVGSRQGLSAGVLGIVVVLFLGIRSGSIRVSDSTKFLVALVCLAVAGATFSSSTELLEWILNRFEIFTGSADLVSEASMRDERMPLILDRLVENFAHYFFGVGPGYGEEFFGDNLWEITYVDSELLMGLQQYGFLGMALYLGFVFNLTTRLFKSEFFQKNSESLGIALFVFFMVGLTMLYGHYLMMNWSSSHAQVGFLYWMMAGLALEYLRSRGKS